MSTPPSRPQIGGFAGKAASTPNKKPSSKSYKETVVLIVGPSKEAYTLHKDLLCFYSDFFRAAFNGSFKEATERKIELPDLETNVFEAFQVWLYTQSLPKNEEEPNTKIYPEWSLLASLWIFGDKHRIPLLQNTVMDAFIAKVDIDHQTPLLVMNMIYENTLPESPLRKAVIDIVAHRSGMLGEKGGKGACLLQRWWTLEACMDLMAVMCAGWTHKTERTIMPEKDKCHYHIHAAGEHC
ncbi:hypothetical protein D6D00_09331 [Aureobasidium pullulans]|nr:hypothetical protein D6D00_09331 [Aureobasidium pullulans]